MSRLWPLIGAAALAALAALSGCNRGHKRVIAVIPKGSSDIFHD